MFCHSSSDIHPSGKTKYSCHVSSPRTKIHRHPQVNVLWACGMNSSTERLQKFSHWHGGHNECREESPPKHFARFFAGTTFFKDIRYWLRKLGAPAADVAVHIKDICSLSHSASEEVHSTRLPEYQRRWDAQFEEHYMEEIHPNVIHNIVWWRLEQLEIHIQSMQRSHKQPGLPTCQLG